MKKIGCIIIGLGLICTLLTSCNNEKNSKDLLYSLNSNTEYVVTGMKNNEDTDIVIPDTYKGLPVIGIEEYAFSYCDHIKSIKIPRSVKKIGFSAFYECNNIESITIPFVGEQLNSLQNSFLGYIFGASTCDDNWLFVPKSLKEVIITGGKKIEEYAFATCISLTTIDISDSVYEIGDSAFLECFSLTTIDIPDSVYEIGDSAFLGCFSLTTIDIPDSVYEIGQSAFLGCSSLTTIDIPDSVYEIGQSAFLGCSSLEKITLPFIGRQKEETLNTHFGYIFGANSYNENSLYLPSSLKEVVIKDSIKIEKYSFFGCNYLQNIIIPSSVTTIEDFAFVNCSNLISIIIPSSVTTIGQSAFSGCNKLTIFCETLQVSSSLASNWNGNSPIYWYSETRPTGYGNYWYYYNGEPVPWW